MFSIVFIISNKVVDLVLDFLHRGSSTGLDSDKQNLFNQKDNLEYNLQDSDLKILGEQDEIFISHSFSKKNADWEKIQFTESINNAITKAQNNPNKTSFGIYNQDGEHWVAYALVCKNDDITILYKDSKAYTAKSFCNGVKAVRPEAKILVNNHQEQEDVVSCGMFSLENIQIMKEQLLQNPEDFIEKFENFQDFYKTENISELRQEYGKKYLIAIANAIAKAPEAGSKYVMKQTIDNLNISGQPELSEEAKNILIDEGIVEQGLLSWCFSRLNKIFDSIFTSSENISELRQEYGKKYLIAIANAIAKALEAGSKYVMKQTIDNLNITGQLGLSEEAKNILIDEDIVEQGLLSSCFSRLKKIFESISISSENISENNIDNCFNKPALPLYMVEGMISYKTRSDIIKLKLIGETPNTYAMIPVLEECDV